MEVWSALGDAAGEGLAGAGAGELAATTFAGDADGAGAPGGAGEADGAAEVAGDAALEGDAFGAAAGLAPGDGCGAGLGLSSSAGALFPVFDKAAPILILARNTGRSKR